MYLRNDIYYLPRYLPIYLVLHVVRLGSEDPEEATKIFKKEALAPPF